MISSSSLLYRIRLSKVNTKMKSTVRSINIPLEIPKVDDRVYCQCVLNNGISVTIVQDKTSEKSSCALSVRTGAMHDPLPGIAHITEHAVFLGSEKYPVENAYKNYLNRHGGGSNASTSMDQTTYKFYVNADAFDPALDIFSQFFKCPLFQTETMCREVMAVDAEDSKNRIIDARRLLQVLKHQIQPQHTYSKFSTGNLKTLVYGDVERYGEHLSKTIRSFHAEYYQPSCMAVSLVGPQSVDDLLALAELHFSSIKNNNPTITTSATATTSSSSLLNLEELKVTAEEDANTANDKLHRENTATTNNRTDTGTSTVVQKETITTTVSSSIQTTTPIQENQECIENASIFTHGGGKLIHLCPIKDIRDLFIIWQLPPTYTLYRENPCDLISYLLNYKGTGSCFAVLQDKKWITTITTDIRNNYENYTLYETKISLTEHGLLYYNEILSLLNEYILLISNTTNEKLLEYWKEMYIINTLKFQYKQKSTAYELAPALSSNMLDYSMEHILSANYLTTPTIDVQLIRRFLSFLDINKSIIFLRSQAFSQAPHLLGSDSPEYLDQQLFKSFESSWHNNYNQNGTSSNCGNSSCSTSTTGSITSHSTSNQYYSTATECSSHAGLEQLRLSGQYFPRLHAYQRVLMQSHHLHSASSVLPEDANLSHSAEAVRLPEDASWSLCMEPYYGVPYTIQNYALNATIKERMNENMGAIELTLPTCNTFISTELLEPPQEDVNNSDTALLHSTPPVRLSPIDDCTVSSTKKGTIWHSRDELFRQPRSIYFHLLHSPSCEDGHPVLSVISQVFAQLTTRRLYQPAVAGLHYSLSLGTRGVGLSFYGFSPRLVDFAETVLHLVHDRDFWTSVEPAVLDMCKDRLLRTYRSWFKERPDAQCESLLRYMLHEGAWLPQHRLAACESIDMPYFQHRVADALDIRNVLTYAHGSCTADMASIAHNKVLSHLYTTTGESTNASADVSTNASDCMNTKSSDLTDSTQCWYSHTERSRILPSGTHNVVALSALNVEDPNSALLTFMQAEISSPALSARLLLLRRLLSEPAFTELRTKRQLGYIVSLSPASFGRGKNAVRGISVRILSKRFSPLSMELALSEFFQQQRSILNDTVTDEIIAERCQSIIHTLEDPPTSYTEEASDYWDAIVHELPFDWTAQVITELKLLNRAEVLEVADRWLFGEDSRASLSVMIFSLQHESEYSALVARQQQQQTYVHSQQQQYSTTTLTPTATTGTSTSNDDTMKYDSRFASSNHTSYHFTIDELVKLRDNLKF